jgi:SnoaL-like domain/Domain of unknown function (DUF4405)
MKSKNLISLMIAFCFLIMSISGILLYLGQKQWHPVETLHILFGMIFLGFAIFHILNNWTSIKAYSRSKNEGKWHKEILVVVLVFVVFLIGGSLEVQPFKFLAFGAKNYLRPKKEQTNDNNNPKEVAAVKVLLADYLKSLNTNDTLLASQIWENSPEVSFIHPLGHEKGWRNVLDNFYLKTMYNNFSNRQLSMEEPTIRVRGNTAWVDFYWDFKATWSKNQEPFTLKGRESQILLKDKDKWKIVQIHYSGMPFVTVAAP